MLDFTNQNADVLAKQARNNGYHAEISGKGNAVIVSLENRSVYASEIRALLGKTMSRTLVESLRTTIPSYGYAYVVVKANSGR